MPSLAANPVVKSEKVPVPDVPESFKSIVSVVEKKCRNLEKRKVNHFANFFCVPGACMAKPTWSTRGRHADLKIMTNSFNSITDWFLF